MHARNPLRHPPLSFLFIKQNTNMKAFMIFICLLSLIHASKIEKRFDKVAGLQYPNEKLAQNSDSFSAPHPLGRTGPNVVNQMSNTGFKVTPMIASVLPILAYFLFL